MTHLIAALYIVHFRPYETRLLQSLEVFNEFTSLVLLYATIGFLHYEAKTSEDSFGNIPSGIDPIQQDEEEWYMLESEERRADLGWLFNGFMGVNVCVHLFFLIRSAVTDCKARC